MTLSDELGGLGNLGEDGDPVTEIDTVVQRAPGKLGFGLTIARDDTMGDCVYVKNVTGITEMQGIVHKKDVISRIDGVAIQGMEYDEVLAKFKAIPTGSGVRLRLIRKEKAANERRSSVEYAQPDYDQGYQYTPPEEEEEFTPVFVPEVDEETQAKMDQDEDIEDDAEEMTNRQSWAPDVLNEEDERSATGQVRNNLGVAVGVVVADLPLPPPPPLPPSPPLPPPPPPPSLPPPPPPPSPLPPGA